MEIAVLFLVIVVGGLCIVPGRVGLVLIVSSFAALTLHTIWPGSGVTQARYERVQFVLMALLPGVSLLSVSSERFGNRPAAGVLRVLLFVVAVLAASNLLHELGLLWWGAPGSQFRKMVRMLIEAACCGGAMLAMRWIMTRLVSSSRV